MRLLPTLLVATLLCGMWGAASAGEPPAARDSISELMDVVRNGLTDEKVAALGKLGTITDEKRLGDFKVPGFLGGVVKSADYPPRARVAAVEALAAIMKFIPDSKDTVINVLTERLIDRNESTAVRRAIAEAMGSFLVADSPGDRNAFNVLVGIARERKDDAPVVGAAIATLGRTGYREALGLVVAGISDGDADVRASSLKALELMFSSRVATQPSSEVVRTLMAMASDDKAPLASREAAMRAMAGAINTGAVKGTEVAQQLAGILEKAPDAKLATAVIDVLTRVPEPASVEALRKAYESFQKPGTPGQDPAEVRVAVAKALGEYLHPLARRNQVPAGQSAAALLIKVCRSDPSAKVVVAAIFSLGNMVDAKYDRREVVRELIETMASDTDKTISQAARDTIQFITQREIASDEKDPKAAAVVWKAWYESNKDTKLAPRL